MELGSPSEFPLVEFVVLVLLVEGFHSVCFVCASVFDEFNGPASDVFVIDVTVKWAASRNSSSKFVDVST